MILSPIPSCISFTYVMLWRLARLTSVPSSSTVSKMATGLMRPVLDGLHSMSRSVVSASSSCHLNAIASLGNFAVVPRLLPYAVSSKESTSPSVGKSFDGIFAEKAFTISGRVSAVTASYSTTSKPSPLRNSNLFSKLFSKLARSSASSGSTIENA